MTKSPQAFRTIGEVSRAVGVATHVLRYWETQFPQLAPVKRADGRRYYRPEDVQLAAGLCEILREHGLTIRGARRLIAPDRGAAVRARGAARLGEAAAGTPAHPDTADSLAMALDQAPAGDHAMPAAPAPGAVRPALATDAGADGQGSGSVLLLGRLALTAAALRAHGAPLPHGASEIARRLRDCHDRMRGAPSAAR